MTKMKSLKNKVALVTGASSGIGEAFVYELAKQGATIIITARTESKLQLLANNINNKFGNKAIAISADLSLKETPQKIYDDIKKMNLTVDLLINNAGIGKWANFLDETMATYETMLELNINAIVKLTHLFLPDMLAKGEGGIINIASTGALQPCPYIATYCASKAFVLSFSEALYGEYNKKGITITALCPGNTSTDFQTVANANTQGMTFDTAETVAQNGIKAFLENKSYKIVGKSNYLQSFLPRFLPRKTIINIVEGMMNKRINGNKMGGH
jgi:short-subunit dehydrogenase